MKNNPKIAIVHDFLIKLGGAEKVLEVIHQIFPDAPIYTLLYDKKGTRGKFENGYEIRTSYLHKYPKFIRNQQKLLLSQYPKAIESFDLSGFDIVISDSNSFAHGVITAEDTLHISYCYSPTRYLWDWYHEYLDENNIGFNLKGIIIRRLLYKLRLWDIKASKRADDWVAISRHVAKRIKKYYGIESSVIYPPVQIGKNYKTKKSDYFVILSRLSPYKRIDIAIEAFNKNKKKLKIIGEGSDFGRLNSMASNNVEFLGFVGNNKKVEKYLSEARALIFPGEEDFGLTPIESMSLGTPVIAFERGGVAETVISGKTGEFFKEPTADSLNKAVNLFEKNRNKYKTSNCVNHAKKFSKEIFMNKFKKYIIDEYKKIKK